MSILIAKVILAWIFGLIFIEAVTEIVFEGKIFTGLRAFLAKRSQFLGKLLSCGYCLSVWTAFYAILLPGEPVSWFWDNQLATYADVVVRIFVAHRLSNMLHELFSRWLNRVPFWLRQSLDVENEDDEVEV